MHPVLVYASLFIVTTVALLFVFEQYHLGSIYLLLVIATVITAIVGKILIRLFPSEDPMQEEITKEQRKVYANQYKREIQFLFNVVQPDPKLQPNPKRISGSLEDCFDLDTQLMHSRLKHYFGDSFDLSTSLPLADIVEELKRSHKNWPDS